MTWNKEYSDLKKLQRRMDVLQPLVKSNLSVLGAALVKDAGGTPTGLPLLPPSYGRKWRTDRDGAVQATAPKDAEEEDDDEMETSEEDEEGEEENAGENFVEFDEEDEGAGGGLVAAPHTKDTSSSGVPAAASSSTLRQAKTSSSATASASATKPSTSDKLKTERSPP